MNHLISKLDPISNFSEILESLKELPSAVRDVAIFKQGVDGLITTMNQRPQLPSASITSLDVESVSSLKQSFDELRQSVTRGTPPTPQADLPDLNRIREGMEGIAKAVEDLKTGLLTPAVTPSYNSDLSKLLEITAALKQDVVDMKNKIDGPHTPVRPVYDSDAIKQQLGGIDDKLDDLKADLRRTASQKPPLAPFLSNTPASGRLPSPPERPVPPPSPRLPLTQISVPSLSPALTRTSTQIHAQARPEASVDIFGPKIRIPAPAITTERKDPFDWMEDLLTSCSPEVSDRPPHTESNKSSRGSRVQSKKARVNPPADPGLVIRTRAMKANEEPIYVSSDSTAGRNNSANSVTVDNNTQTVSGPSTQVTMAPFDVGSLPGGVRRTPTGRFGKTPKTYGSGDKKKSGKKRFSSDE